MMDVLIEMKIAMQTLRLNAGLTARFVAQSLDVAESTVRNWDKGRSEPRLKLGQVKKLIELYQCSLDDLLEAITNSQQ